MMTTILLSFVVLRALSLPSNNKMLARLSIVITFGILIGALSATAEVGSMTS